MEESQISSAIKRLTEVVSRSNFGGIIIPPSPNVDTVAATTSLYLSLIQKGITIILACESDINYDLIGSEKFQKSLSAPGDNLVISFPYVDGSIDKIDYRIENDRFNLIIIPRDKDKKLSSNQVSFYYTGGSFDFLIILNASTLNALGSLYKNSPELFQGREIINIDRHFTNANFGTINIVKKNISSLSELIYLILKEGDLPIDKDIATNLYAGIASATNNFTSFSTNADTFQSVAELLRHGAIKKIIKTEEKLTPKPKVAFPSFPQTFSPQSPKLEKQTIKPMSNVEKETKTEEPKTPEEWLKPKIFKGSGLI